MIRWALAAAFVLAFPAGAQGWATATPRPTPRPTYPPAPTRTPTPRPTSTPSSQATSTPSPQRTPTPGSGMNYYLVPLVPVLPVAIGEPLRYADGIPITMTVRLSSGEIRCQIVRVEP